MGVFSGVAVLEAVGCGEDVSVAVSVAVAVADAVSVGVGGASSAAAGRLGANNKEKASSPGRSKDLTNENGVIMAK